MFQCCVVIMEEALQSVKGMNNSGRMETNSEDGAMALESLMRNNLLLLNAINAKQHNDIHHRPSMAGANMIGYHELTSRKQAYQWTVNSKDINLSSYVCLLDQINVSVQMVVQKGDGKPISGWTYTFMVDNISYEMPVIVRFLGVHSLFAQISFEFIGGGFNIVWPTSTDLFQEIVTGNFFNTSIANHCQGGNVEMKMESIFLPDSHYVSLYSGNKLSSEFYLGDPNLYSSWFTSENYTACNALNLSSGVVFVKQQFPHPISQSNANRYCPGIEFTVKFYASLMKERGFLVNPSVGQTLDSFDASVFIPDDGIKLIIPYYTTDRMTVYSESAHLDITKAQFEQQSYGLRNTLLSRTVKVHQLNLNFNSTVVQTIPLGYFPRRAILKVVPKVKKMDEEGFGVLDSRESVLKGITLAGYSMIDSPASNWLSPASKGNDIMYQMYTTFSIQNKKGRDYHSSFEYGLDFNLYCKRYFFVPFCMDVDAMDDLCFIH